MSDRIELTGRERVAGIAALRQTTVSTFGYGMGTAFDMVIEAINEVRAHNETFRAVVADLERLDRSGLSFSDRVRDLMLSYDITPKSS